jgi:hypothetical protein
MGAKMNSNQLLRAIVIAATCAAASAVAAQADEEPQPEVRYEKRTLLNFDPVQMKGKRQGPDGVIVKTRAPTRFRSLVKPRANFRRELIESIGEL